MLYLEIIINMCIIKHFMGMNPVFEYPFDITMF